MKTTAQYLDAMRAKLDLPSDGKLADHLGIHRQHMSRYRTGAHGFDEMMCIKVAAILEIEPEIVLVDMMYLRAKQPEVKAAWKHTAETLFGLAAALALVAILPTATAHLPATDTFNVALRGLTQFDNSNFMAHGIYIMRILDTYTVHLISLFFIAFFFRPGKNRRLFDSFRMNAAIRALRRSAADARGD